MTQKASRTPSVLLTAAAVAFVISCQADTSSWYPKCTAEVASFYEITAAGAKSCVITLHVHNTGTSKTTTSTVSVQVKTATQTYYSTVVSSTAILPGGSIFFNASATYLDVLEATSSDKIAVVDQFYE